VTQAVIEFFDLLRRRAFLRAEDRGGAVTAEEGVADVAGDDELDAARVEHWIVLRHRVRGV
jgi:hypothetical protein